MLFFKSWLEVRQICYTEWRYEGGEERELKCPLLHISKEKKNARGGGKMCVRVIGMRLTFDVCAHGSLHVCQRVTYSRAVVVVKKGGEPVSRAGFVNER